jgi:NAD(P)-dependent dehydrogenase (short-subunit alcohol dehydrogenase family)
VVAVPLDVTDERSVADGLARVREETGGRLDAVVNNAGIPGAGPVEALPLETFRAVIETNLVGAFTVTKACLPMLRASAGRIVMVSSLGGRVAFPYASAYHASKFGLEGLAESLRAEVRPLDVDVVIVEPASMATAIWEKGRDSLAESRELMTAEQTAVYGSALETFDGRLKSAEDSEDPREVASAIREALTTGSPSERYPVGRGARTLATLRPLLPDALYDRVAARVAGG